MRRGAWRLSYLRRIWSGKWICDQLRNIGGSALGLEPGLQFLKKRHGMRREYSARIHGNDVETDRDRHEEGHDERTEQHQSHGRFPDDDITDTEDPHDESNDH